MPMLDDIATYLAQQGITQAIHKGYMPDEPDNVVGLFEYGGEPSELTMGDGDPVIERPGLQVRVRDMDYQQARAVIGSIIAVLHGATSLTAGDGYLLIRANQSPASIGRDANNRSELVVNFSIIRER